MPTGKRFLITGGCGFVGRHFSRELVAQGNDVVVVDPLTAGSGGLRPEAWPTSQRDAASAVSWINTDCREFFKTTRADEFDAVFHLAAIVGGRLSIERAALAVAQDLAIDAAMFEWAAETSAKHVAYFSSSAAYPISLQTRENKRLLLEEDIDFVRDIGVPDLSYGWSKLTGEFLGRLAAERYGLKVASYRPFSGYGSDQDLNYPFPSIVNRVLAHEQGTDFIVWGSGDQERDFLHIEDCVKYVLATYEDITDGTALNLSSGEPTSFRALAELVADVAGVDIGPVVGDTSKPEGVFSRVGDKTKQDLLGLKPSVSLREGVAAAVAFRREIGIVR